MRAALAALAVLAALALVPASAGSPRTGAIIQQPQCDIGEPTDCWYTPPPPPDSPPPAPESWLEYGETVVDSGGYQLLVRNCRTISGSKTVKSYLLGGNTEIRQDMPIRFCWSRGAVVYVESICFVGKLTSDEVQTRGPCVVGVGDFYMWNNNPRGGLLVTGTGAYQQCLGGDANAVCYRNFGIETGVFVHGDGTYHAKAG